MKCQKSEIFERDPRFRKKGQITLFIIIGLVILILVGIAIWYYTMVGEEAVIPDIARVAQVPADVQPIESYIESCLIEKAIEALEKLGDRGGYIEPEKHGLSVGTEPTESELVNFAPGSDLNVPYWFYLKSNNKCTGRCEFQIVPENELYLYRKSGEVSIEGQLDEYINEHLATCLADFQVFRDQGFVIDPMGEIKTTTKIGIQNIEFYVNYPLAIERNGRVVIEHYYVVIPLNLRKIYEQAVIITNLEGEYKFLERNVLNLIEGFTGIDENLLPPTSDSTFRFGRIVTWRKSEVKQRVQEMLSTYIQMLQVYGSLNYEPYDVSDELSNTIYNAGMVIPSNVSYQGLAVYFSYLDFWDPIYFDINCNGELCQPESVTNPFLTFMGVQRYDFVYDVSFPVMVEIHDPSALNNRGYTFRFFLEGNIRNNAPLVPAFNPIIAPDASSGSMLCDIDKRNSGNISIKVFDGDSGAPLDGVQLMYSCTQETCYIGETKDGTYNGKFPVCLGGILGYIKEDYLGKSRILTTALDVGDSVEDVSLFELKDKPFVLMKKKVVKTSNGWQYQNDALPLEDNEEAMVVLTRKGEVEDEEFSTMSDFIGNQTEGTIRIAPGVYDINIQLMTRGELVIPERTETICTMELPIVGCVDEETITFPEIRFNQSKYPSGGLQGEYEFTKEDLAKDKIVFYAVNPDITGVPESNRVIDDLEEMNKVEEYSEAHKSSLRPRFT